MEQNKMEETKMGEGQVHTGTLEAEKVSSQEEEHLPLPLYLSTQP